MKCNRILTAVTGTAILLSGCTSVADKELMGFQDPSWGEANRQTMAAQVIDPDPQYDTAIPPTSATNAVSAIERYANGNVEQPDRISTSDISSTGPQ
jgi:hypothetical protein